jgi:peptidoglycan/LPS O-acetylase OafA/YrhL
MPIKYNQRHFGLDFIRALAILSVVFGHSAFILKPIIPSITSFPYLRGVDVFFVLSGYLIGTRFLQRNQKDKGVKSSYGKSFLNHAAWRILPMYFLFLIINLIVGLILFPQDLNFKNVFPAFFLLQNVYSPHIGFFWESWSLPITVFFYLIITTVFITIAKLNLTSNKFKFSIFIVVLFFIILPASIRVLIHYYEDLSPFMWDIKIRKFLPTRIDSPFFGFLAAWLRFYYPKYFKKLRIPGLITGAAIYLYYYFVKSPAGSIDKDVLYVFASPLAYSLMLPSFMYLKRAANIIAKPITFISLTSYAIYLVNLLLIIILKHTSFFKKVDPVIAYVIYWVGTLFIAWFFYNFYEIKIRKQFDKWKKSGIAFKLKN